jgi:VWFA-related protein
MDALNTKLTDQAFVKSETLAYLKSLTPGTRVAIMTLSNQLRVLQGFTQDGAILSAAVKSKNNRQLPSPLLNSDLDDSIDTVSDMITAGTATALQEFSNETNAFQTNMRNQMTLEALDQIAGYLATIPGRKNLIWFTAGIPLQMFPQGGVNDLATMTDYTKDLRKTTDLLTAAQIAVYPIDAQGLHGNMQGSATSAGSGFANGNGGAKMAASNLAFLEKTGAEQLSMVAIAEATGGVAYFNTNGLKEAIAKAVDNGANYYTLSYVPPIPKYDGAFHKITVKVDHPGAKFLPPARYSSMFASSLTLEN